MNIEELKSKSTSNEAENTDKAKELNLENKPVRDFGNGLKEFSPEANGIKPAEVRVPVSTEDEVLRVLDEVVIPRKIAETRAVQEAIELAGGELSEEELRESMGQSYITEQLHDGAADLEQPIINNDGINDAQTRVDSEIEELERDLGNMDNTTNVFMTDTVSPKTETKITPISNHTNSEYTADHVQIEKPSVSTPAPMPTPAAAPVDNKVDVTEELSEEDKDLKALDGEISDPNEFEEKLKKAISEALAPVNKQLGISGFTIAKTSVNANNVIAFPNTKKKAFKWVLFNSKQPIAMSPYTADELSNISTNSRDSTTAISAFRTIYDHIVSPKANSFDAWAKSISFFDMNHLYMAMYGACFNDANYIPFNCPHCNSVMVTTDIPLMDMVKFENDKIKQEFYQILEMPFTENMGTTFAVNIVPISEKIAVGVKMPSIYSAIIEIGNLDREFRDKYSDILQIVMYIDNIYVIDRSTPQATLYPIMYKEYTGNAVKSFKSRIIQWAKIIRTLSSDEYNNIASAIMAIDRQESINAVTYQTPAVTCNNDKCKKEIPAEVQSARDLVFTRHQLGIYGRL